MFSSSQDIYQHIAGQMVQSIQEPNWTTSWLVIFSNYGSETIRIKTGFYSNNDPNTVKAFDPFHCVNHGLGKATSKLYELMKEDSEDKPFNKYKFTLNNDGTFDVEFKYDQDYEYIFSIHPDSEEYDSIEVKDMRAIKSWEGLPKDHPRPWLYQ